MLIQLIRDTSKILTQIPCTSSSLRYGLIKLKMAGHYFVAILPHDKEQDREVAQHPIFKLLNKNEHSKKRKRSKKIGGKMYTKSK